MDSRTLSDHYCGNCHYEWCRTMDVDELEYCLDHEDDWDHPCQHWQPMDNGDYIRSLNNEELAEYMNGIKFIGTLLTKNDWLVYLGSEYGTGESN